MTARTMFDKIWDQHVVEDLGDGVQLLHVDRHLMHELSGHRGQLELKARGIRMRNPGLTIGSMDHVVSTAPGAKGGNAPWADKMIDTFRLESRLAGVKIYDIGQDGQGIVHVVGPELGFTLPGVTLLCGDSHTCTHGALGALAWGIGTSELTHVLATQTIVQQRPKTMCAHFDGKPARAVTAKDMILALIGKIGTAIERLNREVIRLLQEPVVLDRFKALAVDMAEPMTPQAFAAYVRSEFERYSKLVPALGIAQ